MHRIQVLVDMYYLCFPRIDGRMLCVGSERLTNNIIRVYYRQQGSIKIRQCKFVYEDLMWKFDGRGVEDE